MLVDFIGLFFIDKMSNSFHHNHLFQKRHMFLEPTFVYVILGAHKIINQAGLGLMVSHNELNRSFNLSPSPGCSQFSIPVQVSKVVQGTGEALLLEITGVVVDVILGQPARQGNRSMHHNPKGISKAFTVRKEKWTGTPS